MLILTRRVGEALYIGDSIKVCVTNVRGNVVRIGFDAPKDVIINREEIYERNISREQPDQQNRESVAAVSKSE